MTEKIKVLVVDDASFMVKAISEILHSDPEIEVIGFANNGQEALEKIKTLNPDVITLDVDMPVMDGIKTVRHIMLQCPVPIVMLSSLFGKGAISFEAFRLGVVDFLAKPFGADIYKSRQQIIARVKTAASINIANLHRVKIASNSTAKPLERNYSFQHLTHLLVLGTTLGGPNPGIDLFSKLRPKLSTAAIVVENLSSKLLPEFVKEFNKYSAWTVREAINGTTLESGVCYLASNEYSLVVEMNNNNEVFLRASKSEDNPLDKLFSSAAQVFGKQTIGGLLTGMGDDGSKGFLTIKKKSGLTLVQKNESGVSPHLVEHAFEKGLVDKVVEKSELVNVIDALIN